MKTRTIYHGKQLQLVLMLAGSSLLASRPATANNEDEYSAEMKRLSTLIRKEDLRFQAIAIDLKAREATILKKKADIEQQEAALTTSILGMDKLIARTDFLFAGNDKDAPSTLASFFQRPAELLRKRAPLPPLLERVEQLHCAQTISEAQNQLDQLFEISAPGTAWPDEWLGKPKTTPQLHAGSMDIILATLKRTIERFPVLRKQTERVALQWDYCPLLEQGVLHDLTLSDRHVERIRSASQTPLDWRGFRQWGFIGSAAERKERFIPSLLDEITLAPHAYQIFLHQAYRQHCFPHPVTGEQYTETDAEKGPLRSFFPPPPDEPVGQYPYKWHPYCEIPQVGFQPKPAWPKAILQKASARLAGLQKEVEATKSDIQQLTEAQQALEEQRIQTFLDIEQRINELEENLADERLQAIEAAEAAAAEANAIEEEQQRIQAAVAEEKRLKQEAEKAAEARRQKDLAEKAARAAAEKEKKLIEEAAAKAAEEKKQAEKAAAKKAAAEKAAAEKAAAEKAAAEKAKKRAQKAAAEAEKAKKLAAAAAAAEAEKQNKLAKIAALKKKEAAEAAQLRKMAEARKAAELKKKLAAEKERKRAVEAQRQFKAATKQAVLEKHNYTVMREPPKGMVVIPTPGSGEAFPFIYVDDQKTPFKDKKAQAKAKEAASKLKISGTFSFNVPVNGNPPSLNSSITITPMENVFLTGSGSFKDGQFTYSWSGGYSNWRPGTFSAQLNNWGPLKPGDGLALDKAVLNLGYKVDSDLLRDKKLSASLGLSAPLSGKTPTVSATMQWTPKENWYFRTTVSESLKGGAPNWNYGFGYYDWRPGTWRVEYSNYGSNKFPFDNFKDGTVTVSRGWSF